MRISKKDSRMGGRQNERVSGRKIYNGTLMLLLKTFLIQQTDIVEVRRPLWIVYKLNYDYEQAA